MKKILSITLVALLMIGFTSCKEEALNTSPTTAVSGEGMFDNADAAAVPLNGIYRAMYSNRVSGGGPKHSSFGICAHNMVADLMADDHMMAARGSGWFWGDFTYTEKILYTSTSRRPYDVWSTYYLYISNANYILNAQHTMQGQPSAINDIIGQAYAIRAYSYFMLAQWFCRTYVGHEDEKGIPIYKEPTIAGTPGHPRGTLRETYEQINSDIDSAILLLNEATPRVHITHIDKYVANGIKARICLVQERWQDALDAAENALGCDASLTDKILGGMNDVSQEDVMWGARIIADQSTIKASFFNHMSNEDSYGQRAPKQINIELYNKMGEKDIRRAWWNPRTSTGGYQQHKFEWADLSQFLGDYIWMRVPEMVLTKAEALCMLGRDGDAQKVLNEFMSEYRDPEYNCTKTGTAMGRLTSNYVGSLREEIIIQRRIELWGEYGRLYDIRRLKQGFTRTTEQGFPTSALLEGTAVSSPETWDWVLTIPQREFDNNKSLVFDEDQNPLQNGIAK